MGDVNYVDFPDTPEKVAGMIEMAASNAAHLARLLNAEQYEGVAE